MKNNLEFRLLSGVDDQIPEVDKNLETPLTGLDYTYRVAKGHGLFSLPQLENHIIFPRSISAVLVIKQA